MANDLDIFKGQDWVVAFGTEFGDAGDGFTSGISSALPARISRKDSKFTPIDADGVDWEASLKLVVNIVTVNPHNSRTFYEGNYGPDTNEAPACFSDNGQAPSVNAASPWSRTCASCPNAVWGSAISKMTGKGVPACQSSKKVAVMIDGDDSNTVFQLMIPPASFKNYAAAINKIRSHRVPPPLVKIELSFPSTGVLDFKPIGVVDADRSKLFGEIVRSGACDEIVGKHDAPIGPDVPVRGESGEAPAAVKREPVRSSAGPAQARPVEKQETQPQRTGNGAGEAQEDPAVRAFRERKAEREAEAKKAAEKPAEPEVARPPGLSDEEWEEFRAEALAELQAKPKSNGRGRPAGSKNKPKEAQVEDLPNPLAGRNGETTAFKVNTVPAQDPEISAVMDGVFGGE